MLGDGHRRGQRAVDDRDAPRDGGGHIDIVHAHTGTPNHLQILPGLGHLGRHLCSRTDDEGMEIRQCCQQFIGCDFWIDRDVAARFQQRDAILGQAIGDKNFVCHNITASNQ